MEGLFENQLFWRARKLVAKKKEDKDKKKGLDFFLCHGIKIILGDESDINRSPRPDTSNKKKEKKVLLDKITKLRLNNIRKSLMRAMKALVKLQKMTRKKRLPVYILF